MKIQEEIGVDLSKIQKKISSGEDLTREESECLFLIALIEEEGS